MVAMVVHVFPEIVWKVVQHLLLTHQHRGLCRHCSGWQSLSWRMRNFSPTCTVRTIIFFFINININMYFVQSFDYSSGVRSVVVQLHTDMLFVRNVVCINTFQRPRNCSQLSEDINASFGRNCARKWNICTNNPQTKRTFLKKAVTSVFKFQVYVYQIHYADSFSYCNVIFAI
jgi:hypothetical protein